MAEVTRARQGEQDDADGQGDEEHDSGRGAEEDDVKPAHHYAHG